MSCEVVGQLRSGYAKHDVGVGGLRLAFNQELVERTGAAAEAAAGFAHSGRLRVNELAWFLAGGASVVESAQDLVAALAAEVAGDMVQLQGSAVR